MYQPRLSLFAQLLDRVLSLNVPKKGVDAILVHAAPIRDDDLDKAVLDPIINLYNDGPHFNIVLNGLTAGQCLAKNLAYGGFKKWEAYLKECGVHEDHIIVMKASGHTAAESSNFLDLAKEKGWKTLGIGSYNHHVLRCFLQIVKLMEIKTFRVPVYVVPGRDLPWDIELKKPVLNGVAASGGGDVQGAFTVHFMEEMQRLFIYAQEPNPVGKFTPHATLEDGLAYLDSGHYVDS